MEKKLIIFKYVFITACRLLITFTLSLVALLEDYLGYLIRPTGLIIACILFGVLIYALIADTVETVRAYKKLS